MCEELTETLKHGNALASQLVDHVLGQGASNAEILIERDSGTHKVKVQMPDDIERETLAGNHVADMLQAIGLLTTLKPDMIIDPANPMDMAKEICEHVKVISDKARQYDEICTSPKQILPA